MSKPLKIHKSYFEQLEKLKEHGLIIEDDENALKFLENVNYYRLSGYLYDFKDKESGKYKSISFERLAKLYNFDAKLTSILMYAVEGVEERIKTTFSYELSSLFPKDPLIYLSDKIYRDSVELDKFKKLFNESKRNNSKLPFVRHHINNYDNNLPIWVAVEIMTMGNIHKLYDNLQTKYQKHIAKKFNTGVMQLKSWLKNITYLRNHLAHYMRIYNYNFLTVPVNCNNNNLDFTSSSKIFNQIKLLGFFFPDKAEWKNYILFEIDRIISDYKEYINLSDIGFPNDWREILLKL